MANFILALLVMAGVYLPFLAAAPATATYNSMLRRYPYLTDLVAQYVTVDWATATPGTNGAVRWGLAGSESCTAHSTPASRTAIKVNSVTEYQWKAQLTLTPGARYCYRIFLDSTDLLGSDASPYFWTQVPAGSSQPFSFAVFSDWGYIGSSGANPDAANVMARLAASGVRFALSAGDNTHPAGTQTEYGDLVQSGPGISGVFGPQYWAKVGAAIALFPAIGNHGYANSDSIHPQFVNWPEDRAVALSGGRYAKDTYSGLDGTTTNNYPSAWYAFDAGNARIYVLTAAWADGNVGTGSIYRDDHDYHWTTGSAEYKWLQNDLATHPAQLKFAVFHFPLYSDNVNDPSDTYLQAASSLQGLFNQYGVNITFSGHSHNYQRFTAPGAGQVSYVTGGAGALVTPINQCSSYDTYAVGWNPTTGVGSSCHAVKPTSASQVYHFLLVTVNGTTVTVAPTDSLGHTFDVQTYSFGG